jgi:hypothetical protein
MNIILGLFFLACLNISLTLLDPLPTNISTYSEEHVFINVTPFNFDKHYIYTIIILTFANNVLPVPGFPYSNIPLIGLI